MLTHASGMNKKGMCGSSRKTEELGVQLQSSQAAKVESVGQSMAKLIWRRFKRNKLAICGLCVIILIYLIILPAEFFAPYGLDERHGTYNYAPPQKIHFDGIRPFVYALKKQMDPDTFRITYVEDKSQKLYIKFFVRGTPYRWGPFNLDLHFFGVENGHVFLLGTDRQGRDLLSRILIGGRVSIVISLFAACISVALGTTLGLVSGFFGGMIDNLIQRVAETVMSFPAIPLWMGLAAAVPPTWNSVKVFFVLAVIMGAIRWGPLCREVRGKVLSIREEDFVMAAKAIGASSGRILLHHLFPLVLTYVTVMGTLLVPWMIMAESTLSFLGLGIRPPMTSWGSLLREAQNVLTVSQAPWLLIPAIFVVITVLAFNFLGEGFRDAADPYTIRR